jgi:hypothetical protein
MLLGGDDGELEGIALGLWLASPSFGEGALDGILLGLPLGDNEG